MKAFSALYLRLDETTSSNAKLAAMADYFRNAPPADAAWAVYFLAGGKPRQLVPAKVLREFAQQAAGMPAWLFEECYQSVGDLAETIALLVPPASDSTTRAEEGLSHWMEARLLPLRGLPPAEIIARLKEYWAALDGGARFVCGKLITGNFRVGVSRLLVTRALAAVCGVDSKRIAQRLVGYTDIGRLPQAAHFLRLIAAESGDENDPLSSIHPYPFFLAQPLQLPIESFAAQLGPPTDWQIEWKWDGIRAQVVKRGGQAGVWSRGEELVTDRFPELAAMARLLPDGTVLDGEIVAWLDQQVQPFARLQQRLGRKNLSAKLLADIPVCLLAYDLLEWRGQDWRMRPQTERRGQLEELVVEMGMNAPALQLSPLLSGGDWIEIELQRQESRSRGVEGMMLKARTSGYGVGRTSNAGMWWKWKVDPFSVDAVLIYAQRGHGRRAGLYSDYTFAVWDGSPQSGVRQLVPFAKAFSGLTDAEINAVDAIIRRTTVEKFGPVRSVLPTQVFELGFEGIARSSRHKSGIAVRFPRMLRWRKDKPVEEADTLETLAALLGERPAA
jgi:DNA ligase-1